MKCIYISFLAFILITIIGCQRKQERISNKNERNQKSEDHSREIHWNYEAENLDLFWGNLSKAYRPCKDGKHQSPVNIGQVVKVDHSLQFNYSATREVLENNSHTIKMKYDSGSYLIFDDKRYELLQFHFHTPSEHHVKGKEYPLEAHLVHARKDTVYLVYSMLFEKGKSNDFIQSFFKDIPIQKAKVEKSVYRNVADLTDSKASHYFYEGSFTTPPCTEGVKWIVSTKPLEASGEQIKRFRLAEGKNARPTHNLYDRVVEKF